MDRSSPITMKSPSGVKEDKVIELSTRSAEAAEAQLERFIESRDEKRRQTEGDRQAEELWMETVRRYHEKERTSLLWERLRYHEAMVRAHTTTHEAIIARHRAELQRCEQLLGISDTKGEAA
jgi:hypothetical protein